MSAPTVTVVIPTHARAAQLEACLGGIAKLNSVPGAFEIVVVDDGGPQSLEPLIASWRDRLPVRLTVREQGGPAKARNDGAAMARGRFLAFIDDEVFGKSYDVQSAWPYLERPIKSFGCALRGGTGRSDKHVGLCAAARPNDHKSDHA